MSFLLRTAAAACLLTSTVALADSKPPQEPVAFGMLGGNTSCVIFAEGRKTSGHFYGVVATSKSVGKLTLIEAQDYPAAPKEVLETQENLNALMQAAQKDHVKYVKIPEKYTPALLEQARATCKATPTP